jgi:DNA modification methylase
LEVNNKVILEQEKLDVINKNRSNLFNWRGQFTPEFVEYILSSFSQKEDFVLDPFSGSGTVLQESAKLGLKAIGLEINPSAYAMSKFFTLSNLSFSDRQKIVNRFEVTLNEQLKKLNGQKIYVEGSDYRESYFNLLKFGEEFDKSLTNKQQRVLLLNMLFKSEKDKGLLVKDSINKSFQYLKKSVFELPYTEQPITAFLQDARCAGDELENQVDLILTSPPYINVFNYHQNYRAIVEIFNFDILKVAHSEFGSNRKNRSNRFKTVIQYCLDMESAIRSFWKSLKLNGKIVLIVGRESNVKSVPFFNGQMVIEIIEKCGGFIEIKNLERKFTNKFGNNIKEDIIIATKSTELSNNLFSQEISVRHLTNSLKNIKNGIGIEIEEAIKTSCEINPSPLFNSKNIIKK